MFTWLWLSHFLKNNWTGQKHRKRFPKKQLDCSNQSSNEVSIGQLVDMQFKSLLLCRFPHFFLLFSVQFVCWRNWGHLSQRVSHNLISADCTPVVQADFSVCFGLFHCKVFPQMSGGPSVPAVFKNCAGWRGTRLIWARCVWVGLVGNGFTRRAVSGPSLGEPAVSVSPWPFRSPREALRVTCL